MFGLGLWEITLILIVSLLVLGPKRLPQLAKQLARFVQDMRKAASDIQMQFEEVPGSEPAEVPPSNLVTNDEHENLDEHGHLPGGHQPEEFHHAHDNDEPSATTEAGPPKPKL